MNFISIIQYYITYVSFLLHFCIMASMNWFCGSSKLAYFYSFQLLILHVFSWAIPDHRYRQWVHRRAVMYYILAGFNVVLYLLGVILGIILYTSSKDGLTSFLGFGMLSF